MSWNFRRSIRLGPFRFNLSKDGVGTSVGPPGFWVGKDGEGREYQRTSIPGTGIYRRDYASAQRPSFVRRYLHAGFAVILAALRAIVNLRWPASRDYAEAVQNPRNCFVDANLLEVVAAVDKLGMPIVWSGEFAYVFKLDKPSSKESLAARCFRGFARQRNKRYKAIDDYLDRNRLPALASFEYESSGIRVNGRLYPLLVMEWVDGPRLDVYLDKVIGNREVILHLADQWIKLIKSLGEAQIAHGDLQHENIIVQNGALRLIDFDGMYVPSMRGWKATELGHLHYQHPLRDAFFFDARLDNFSALVIHVSLSALAENPQLWAEYHEDNLNLIFKKDDFLKPSQSSLFRKVKAIGGECERLSAILEKACAESVAACPNLLDLATPKSK